MSDLHWRANDPDGLPPRPSSGVTMTSQYVTLADGTRLSVDVYLPADHKPDDRLPTVFSISPYFKSIEFRHRWSKPIVRRLSLMGAAEFAESLAPYGFASVAIDMRGAGASYGSKRSNMMPDVVRDSAQVMDWVVAQPWSNGKIATTGVSAPGMTAMWLASAKHPALAAIIPRFTVFDIYRSTRPGGLQANRFVADVSRLVRAMEGNQLPNMSPNPLVRLILRALIKGLRPVDDDHDRSQLTAAVADHARNEQFDTDLPAVEFRDDPLIGSSVPATLDSCSPATFASDLEASEAPYYAWAGWYDGGFCREMISLFNTVQTPDRRLVIGPWAHGGRWYSGPDHTSRHRRRKPTQFDHIAEMARFISHHLREENPDFASEPAIHYYTMGEERWKTAQQWPPPGASDVEWFVQPGGGLGRDRAAVAGGDEHRVDFEVSTGRDARFGRHIAGGRHPVRYPDRRSRDRRLLCFTSGPLPDDAEVTGHPSVTLFVASTATDGAVIVHLERVTPDGHVMTLTDGQLRLRFAAPSAEPSAIWEAGPYRRYTRADARPVEPGAVVQLDFDLYPTSYLLRRGDRLRLAIAGADKDSFLPVAADQRPTLRVLHGPDHPSCVRLPVIAGSTTSPRT